MGGGRFELPRLAAQGPKPCMSAIPSPAPMLTIYRKISQNATARRIFGGQPQNACLLRIVHHSKSELPGPPVTWGHVPKKSHKRYTIPQAEAIINIPIMP